MNPDIWPQLKVHSIVMNIIEIGHTDTLFLERNSQQTCSLRIC